MNAKPRRYYERGQRCDKFADSRPDALPAGSKGAREALRALAEAVAETAGTGNFFGQPIS